MCSRRAWSPMVPTKRMPERCEKEPAKGHEEGVGLCKGALPPSLVCCKCLIHKCHRRGLPAVHERLDSPGTTTKECKQASSLASRIHGKSGCLCRGLRRRASIQMPGQRLSKATPAAAVQVNGNLGRTTRTEGLSKKRQGKKGMRPWQLVLFAPNYWAGLVIPVLRQPQRRG